MSEQPTQSTPAPTKSNPLISSFLVVGLVVALLFLIKFMSDRAIPDAPGVTLTDMRSIEDLQARFTQDHGTPRLVLLLSPT